MATVPKFTALSSLTKYKKTYSNFRGIDLSSVEVAEMRSPDAINVIPGLQGNPRKRCGYELLQTLGGRINGQGGGMIHAGTTLYKDGAAVFTGLADALSTFETMTVGGITYTMIFDGQRAVIRTDNGTSVYTGWADTAAAGYEPYIPTLLIAKMPNAENSDPGGTAYEDLNLLSRKWKERFCVSSATSAATGFTLSFDELAADAVQAWVLNASGDWDAKTENTDFTVDRTTGVVTFGSAPGASPSEGVDNVIIQAAKDFYAAYTDNPINSVSTSIMYGLTDVPDRIFGTNGGVHDRWCAYRNPLYWGETWYSDLSGAGDGIVGYSLLQGYLATHIKGGKGGRGVVLREGTTDTSGNALFKIYGTKQGEEAIAPHAFAFLEEPLFLTRRGVFAFTPSDITGERYEQVRSFYINKELCALAGLKDAYATKWREYYVLKAGDSVYLLDSSQRFYNKNEPSSGYQYECYKWTNVPARILWSQKDSVEGVEVERLYFGDDSGHVFNFYTDEDDPECYHDWSADGGTAIEFRWDFPDFYGRYFWENKNVKFVAVTVAPHVRTSVEIWARKKGAWYLTLSESTKTRYLSWESIKYSGWTWSGDASPKTIGGKKKNKKFALTRYRVRNAENNEPFGLYQFGFEYTEPGSKYKG